MLSDQAYAFAWLLDSLASCHVTPHRAWFSSYREVDRCIDLGLEQSYAIAGIGDVHLALPDGTSLMLRDVLHVPMLSKGLLSIYLLHDGGYTVSL